MVPFVGPLLLKLSPIGSLIKAIPSWVKIAIGILLAAVVLFLLHGHAVKKAYKAAYNEGAQAAYADDLKKALELQARVDAATAIISAKIRTQTDEENRNIARRADDLRLRGPGKATCVGYAQMARQSSGPVSPSGAGNATLAEVPNGQRVDLIALPFAPTVAFGEQADLNRTEVLAWREWYRQQSVAWRKESAEHSK